ncbi:unnamed protein product, partial [marine sediment metagenome]
MPTYSQYSYDVNQLQKFANQVKEVLISYLAQEGVIDDPQKAKETYAIIISEKGWLGTQISKLVGHKDEGAMISV